METALDTIRSSIRKMETDLARLREAERALAVVTALPVAHVPAPPPVVVSTFVDPIVQKTGGFSVWNSVRDDFVNNNVSWDILQTQYKPQARGINDLRRAWFEDVSPRMNVSSFHALPYSEKRAWYVRAGLEPYLADRSYTVPTVHNVRESV